MSPVHIFLCHNSKDKRFVRKVYDYIDKYLVLDIFRIVKMKAWIDEKEFIPGDNIDQKIEREIYNTNFGIIFLSPYGIGNYQIWEIILLKRRINDKKEYVRIIPILLPGIKSIEDVEFPVDGTIKYILSKKDKVDINSIDEQKIKQEIQDFLKNWHWIQINWFTKLFWSKSFLIKIEESIKSGLDKNIFIKIPDVIVSGGAISIIVVLLIGLYGKIARTQISIPHSQSTHVISQPSAFKSKLTTNNLYNFKSIDSKNISFAFESGIKPIIDFNGNFYTGLAKVVINGKMGYIDRKGNTQIPPNFDWVGDFSKREKLSLAWNYGKNRGYIDNYGNYKINPQYAENMSGKFSQGKAYVCHASTCGYIDTTGKTVIPRQFTGAGNFSEGLAPVRLNDKWGYINKFGEFIIPESFDEAYPFQEGLAAVKKDNQWIYINKKGRTIIQGNFDSISYFSEGIAAVKQNNKWGYINKKGIFTIQPEFNNPKLYDRQYYCDATAIISNKAECKYLDNRYDFSEGLASIYKNGKWGFINRQGNFTIEARFTEANNFSERLALVCIGENKNTECGYIIHPYKNLVINTLDSMKINLHDIPSSKAKILDQIRNGTFVALEKEETNSYKETWYKVKVNNKVGWIRSDLIK